MVGERLEPFLTGGDQGMAFSPTTGGLLNARPTVGDDLSVKHPLPNLFHRRMPGNFCYLVCR